MAQNLVIRHDDFDFRLDPEDYIKNHEEFIKAGVVETAVLQFAQFGRLGNINPDLAYYMTTAPNWDIQIHGWEHGEYDKMDYSSVMRDMTSAMYLCETYFKVKPTVWYPPWNRYGGEMQNVADFLGLKIDNESNDIAKFCREVPQGIFHGHSLYFHLWNKHERDLIPEMLSHAKFLIY